MSGVDVRGFGNKLFIYRWLKTEWGECVCMYSNNSLHAGVL